MYYGDCENIALREDSDCLDISIHESENQLGRRQLDLNSTPQQYGRTTRETRPAENQIHQWNYMLIESLMNVKLSDLVSRGLYCWCGVVLISI